MKVNLSIPCEFTDEEVESAVMAMLKHQPMTNGELLRKFSVPCWDVVNDALTRLLAGKKVREVQKLDGIVAGLYFVRTDYEEWVLCPIHYGDAVHQYAYVTCRNRADIENPLYDDTKRRCKTCGRLLDE